MGRPSGVFIERGEVAQTFMSTNEWPNSERGAAARRIILHPVRLFLIEECATIRATILRDDLQHTAATNDPDAYSRISLECFIEPERPSELRDSHFMGAQYTP